MTLARCPRQDSNLRSASGGREPLSTVASLLLCLGLPDHLCLRSPPCRVVESTIDSTSHDPVDSRGLYQKLATARIAMDVWRIEDLLLAFSR